jgi:tetratricopeptide (TPR) repeat protein
VFCKRGVLRGSILAAVLLSSCARQPAPAIQRLAIRPLENLSSDPQSNWFSRAFAAAVVYDLAGVKNIFAQTVESVAAAPSIQATRALEGYFIERNGRVTIRATVEDLRTSRAVEHIEIEGSVGRGFLPLANEIARRLSATARTFGTSNENAFRFYGQALEGTTIDVREKALESAIAVDPGFVVIYRDQARLLVGTGAKDRALQVLQAGERQRPNSIDSAEMRYVAASISGDTNGRVQALETLARATPSDATPFAELGEAQYARRNFTEAARSYQTATLLNPDQPNVWNEMGYALAWTRNLNGARQALEEYGRLSSDATNSLDSLGEVSFFLGDFEAATKYFEQAAQKDRAELLKAAESRLMTGDLKNADALFAKYIGPTRGASAGRASYQTAQWEFLTGRRRAAEAALEKLLPQLDPETQSLGLSQLAIWKLESGDQKTAMDLANQAVAHSQSPQTRGMAGLSRFLAAGSGGPSGSVLADAYAMLFARKFQEAVPLLQKVYQELSPSSDGNIRVLLAWARMETGGIAEAGKLLEMCPLPLSSGEPLFASLIFPRYFGLRATVLEKQGKADEAKKNRELFLKYTGGAK